MFVVSTKRAFTLLGFLYPHRATHVAFRVYSRFYFRIHNKVSGKAGLSEYLQLLSGLDQFIALHTSYLLNTRSHCLTALLHRLPEIDDLLPLRFRCATALANGYYATSRWLDASNQN